MNDKIPTAKEFINLKQDELRAETGKGVVEQLMTEYAKLHVEAALKAASEKAESMSKPYFEATDEEKLKGISVYLNEEDDIPYDTVFPDKESILSAYPLTNIQ